MADSGQPRQRCSVAMCTYNGETFLPAQLGSLASQERLPDELVICDDGSTDGTVSLAKAFATAAAFPVKVVRNEHNLGYSRNFVKAAGLCSGEWIALADQDDLWHPQKLARLDELFAQDSRRGGIFSDGDLIGQNSLPLPGDLWGSFGFTPREQARLAGGEAVDVLLQRNVVTGMAFAFRSEHRPLLAGMPASWPHDAWLALMLAREDQLHACPERLVAYRVHGTQQIGVPITFAEKRRYLRERGPGAYLQLSRDRNVEELGKTAAQFEDLAAVMEAGTVAADAALLGRVRAKAAHARRGVKLLQVGRVRRWPGVLRQWQDYRRYAPTGEKAMIRDLLL